MKSNNFYLELDILEKTINILNEQKEKQLHLLKKINDNYEEFKNYNMAGKAITEIYNDYDYGIKKGINTLNELNNNIAILETIRNEYSKMTNEIIKSVGDNNGLS